MLSRILEPEVMDSPQEALDYDQMDHTVVNRLFVDDFLSAAGLVPEPASCHGLGAAPSWPGWEVLDLGTGTAQIPIELGRRGLGLRVLAVDLAASMLKLAAQNVAAAGLEGVVRLERVDAKQLPYAADRFDAVMSNSIVHHIPQPAEVLREACRVLRPGGLIFVRDLLRPGDDHEVRHLVDTYAADANEHQRQMFADSLRAALSLDEVGSIVAALGFDPAGVRQTTDRHWTWIATKEFGARA